jgi:hypothetical protein
MRYRADEQSFIKSVLLRKSPPESSSVGSSQPFSDKMIGILKMDMIAALEFVFLPSIQ